ncbi:MAG: enoyl-CoA hydratase-related protein [Alphaproteobacteria bacterium]
MTSVVLTQKRDGVYWLTINRPERRNAINAEVMAALSAGVEEAMADDEARAIVLTGAADKAFCAGGDLDPDGPGSPFAFDHSRPNNPVANFFRLLETCNLPVIARVNGHALAGGLGLMCACDMVVAVDDATFGTPETAIGLFPLMILPYILRAAPRRKALELCITGERFSASEALAMDLVNYVVPRAELDAKMDWLLGRVTNKSPTAIRLGKLAYHAMQDMSLKEALDYAQIMLPMMARSEDTAEGMRSFMEKRPPAWTGK